MKERFPAWTPEKEMGRPGEAQGAAGKSPNYDTAGLAEAQNEAGSLVFLKLLFLQRQQAQAVTIRLNG